MSDTKVVYISWIDPKQSVDLYPEVLNGLEIQQRIPRPDGEHFIVATSAQAEELKSRMEKYIPKKTYAAHDEEGKLLNHVVSEPTISIREMP